MGFFEKLKQGLSKTASSISSVFTASELDDEFYDDLEESLIVSDLGMDTTEAVMDRLRQTAKEQRIKTVDEAKLALRGILADMLNVGDPALKLDTKPSVILVIGVNGVGKTTTKEMTWFVLNEKFNALKTEGNLNNNIGLPRTLLRMDENTQAAVIEMGMSNRGEISELSLIAEPTVAIISNIGVSHMENLGSRENILKAKLEILDGLRENCPILLNGDDPYLAGAVIENHPVIYYGIDDKTCDFRAINIEQCDESTEFDIVYEGKTQHTVIPTIGRHNVYNALAAFGTGMQLGVTPEEAVRGLAKYTPSGMRQRMKIVNGIKFIEDCYNASPDSQRAALKMLSEIKADRKIAVLGDMLELGTISEESHRNAGLLAAKTKVDVFMTYGERSLASAEKARECGVREVYGFTDKKALADKLFETLKPGDAVLFKASRGMALEDVINDLYGRMK